MATLVDKNHPEDLPWIAAWTADWLKQQRLGQRRLSQPAYAAEVDVHPIVRTNSLPLPAELEPVAEESSRRNSGESLEELESQAPLARTKTWHSSRLPPNAGENDKYLSQNSTIVGSEREASSSSSNDESEKSAMVQTSQTPATTWGYTPTPWSPPGKTHAPVWGSTPTPWLTSHLQQSMPSSRLPRVTSHLEQSVPASRLPSSVEPDSPPWGQTPTPWSGLQRQLAETMDDKIWDRAEDQAVAQILDGGVDTELPELSTITMEGLLRPRGFELPNDEEEVLGSGSFGRVIKISRSCDGRLFAMKRQFLGDFAEEVIPVLREISILNAIKGARNVVQVDQEFLVRPVRIPEVWVVMEYFPHNLNSVHRHFRSEELARCLVFQLLLGLNSLHSADIVHRDLKPANILIDLGNAPPNTMRAAICDFGISRSIHGIASAPAPQESSSGSEDVVMTRTVTTRVTSSFWRAPEMWGWADANRMTKQDLKSLDVFGLGLVWAGLLAGCPVILCDEDNDPPRFRLLEILQKVDRPSEEDLRVLSFCREEEEFIKCLLTGDIQALLQEMLDPTYPRLQQRRKDLLTSPYMGIRRWLEQKATQLMPDSQTPVIIQSLARFSYRARPTVEEVLEYRYFADLRAESLPEASMTRQAPPLDDVREALDEELKHQVEGMRNHAQAQYGSEEDEANVKASVRQVYNQVRAEIVRSKVW